MPTAGHSPKRVGLSFIVRSGMDTVADKSRLNGFLAFLAIAAFAINCLCASWRSAPAFVSVAPQTESPHPTPVTVADNSAALAAAQQARQEAAAQQRVIQEAAARRAAFLGRYLAGGLVRAPGVAMVAVVAVNPDGTLNRAVSSAIGNHLSRPSIQVLSSVFNQEFVSDGLFKQVFGGSTEPLRNLELGTALDALVLARQAVQYSPNPDLNVITAALQLAIVVVPIAQGVQAQSWSLNASGAGYTQASARQLAEDRLLKEIAKADKMVLQ